MKEVKRHAKVGEYIKRVNCDDVLKHGYENGDIFEVSKLDLDKIGVWCVSTRYYCGVHGWCISNSEYIVLEDYQWDLDNPILNEEREEKDMNKVLKLYEDRKHAEINKKYEEKIDNDLNSIDIIKQYKTLIKNFEKEQESLFKTIENFDNDYLVPSCDSNCYKYKLNTSSAKKELMDKYREEWEKELSSLYELTAEVDAQLSLSEDLNYQMEVLTRYDIIDKKTNKVKA